LEIADGQLVRNGIAGHLTLWAVVAAVYPFIWRRDRLVVLNGLLFGAVFLISAHALSVHCCG
jgi:hypothetical protein